EDQGTMTSARATARAGTQTDHVRVFGTQFRGVLSQHDTLPWIGERKQTGKQSGITGPGTTGHQDRRACGDNGPKQHGAPGSERTTRGEFVQGEDSGWWQA